MSEEPTELEGITVVPTPIEPMVCFKHPDREAVFFYRHTGELVCWDCGKEPGLVAIY